MLTVGAQAPVWSNGVQTRLYSRWNEDCFKVLECSDLAVGMGFTGKNWPRGTFSLCQGHCRHCPHKFFASGSQLFRDCFVTVSQLFVALTERWWCA